MSDVWNDAAEATTGPKRYFGQLLTEAYYAHIKKGSPKEQFDPGQHNEANKYVVVKIGSITTLDDGRTFDINREYICPKTGSSLGKEWAQIVNPSLKKLGIHPRTLADKWACWEMVPTGRTWISNRTNEQVEGTAHKFLEFYPDEDTCRAEEAAFYNRSDEPVVDPLDETHPMPEEDTDKQRAAMAQFLPMIWTQTKEADAFYKAIAGNPMVAKFFDSNSPEVKALVEAGAEVAA